MFRRAFLPLSPCYFVDVIEMYLKQGEEVIQYEVKIEKKRVLGKDEIPDEVGKEDGIYFVLHTCESKPTWFWCT